jgi:gas vesicle protein
LTERTAIALSVLAGAVVGGVAGYLFFTEDGRQLREELEPRLHDLAREIDKARSIMEPAPRNVRPFER